MSAGVSNPPHQLAIFDQPAIHLVPEVAHPVPGVVWCQRCGLHATCNAPVAGRFVQSPVRQGTTLPEYRWAKPRLMIVGEAPGREEDVHHLPFVGKSGKLLTDLLDGAGLGNFETYITNAVKCRPPGNKTPTVAEIVSCQDWLRVEIDKLQPHLILCVGLTGARSLFGTGKAATYKVADGQTKKGAPKWREPNLGEFREWEKRSAGSKLDYFGTPVMVTYHPAAGLRYPRYLNMLSTDLRNVAERLGVTQAQHDPREYRDVTDGDLTGTLMRYRERFIDVLGFDGYNDPECYRYVSLDTEYEDDGRLIVVSWSLKPGTGFMIRVDRMHDQDAADFLHGLFALMKPVLGRHVYHNAPADVPKLEYFMQKHARQGWAIKIDWSRVDDTQRMAYVLGRPAGTLALKALSESELNLKVIRLEEIREKGQKIADVPDADLLRYACQDPDVTLRLAIHFHREFGVDLVRDPRLT